MFEGQIKMLNQPSYLQVQAQGGENDSGGAGWLSLGRKAPVQTQAGGSECSPAPALAQTCRLQ